MMGDDDFKKRWEELSMYTHHGNRNLHDLKGKAAMHALGDDKCMKNIALSDKGVGEYNPYDEEGEF